MRTEITDRAYRVFTYQSVDRVPDHEFGYWPQTIRRWLGEGLDLELTADEKNQMFCGTLDRYFGFEGGHSAGIDLKTHMNPTFETEIIERKENSVIMRDGSGAIAERYEASADQSSIPHFLKFPVETPDDWAEMKEHFAHDDPTRELSQENIQRARKAADEGKQIGIGCTGFYGVMRGWMGFENLSCAFFEYPDMIHDMVEHWAGLYTQQISRLPDDLPIDHVSWWEDMACKNGPLVGPDMFRKFIQPGYHAVMGAAAAHGAVLSIVDCDGDPHDIVGNWLEEGVNIMFPLEVAAGVDPFAWREEFGKDLRMQGCIDKRAVAAGPEATDKELERIKPLLDQGGFVPHLDHLVPPDISFDNYRYYLDKKRKMIGR